MPLLRKYIAVFSVLLGTMPGLRAELQVGDTMPDLEEMELTGGSLPETKGRVVLLDFWASWCAPCKASFPAYGRIHRDYEKRGLLVLAVGVDKQAAAHERFVRKMMPGFVTLHDGRQKLVGRVSVPAMPTSYLFDRHGRLRFIHRGFHGESTTEDIRQQIEFLLGENA